MRFFTIKIKETKMQKRKKNLLIDAGCRINGYASDITRTSVKMSIDSLFRDLLVGMEYVEHELVNLVKPGVGYPDLHSDALVKIGKTPA